jgi:Bacterial Ig-like domain (group 2)
MALAACGGGTGPTPPGVASVSISPDGITVPVGGSGQLDAVALDAAQTVVSGVVIGWSTTNPVIASVGSHGLVSGHVVGQTLAIAAAGDRADTVLVVVVDNLVLEVVPPDTTIGLFETAGYGVIATDGAGDTVPAPPVTWSSSDHSVATIDTAGLATGIGVGSSDIVATAGTVSSPPAHLHVAATAGPCYGITSAMTFDGTINFGFKVVDQQSFDGGFLITADDNGHLHATMTLQSSTPFSALWTGALDGSSNASVTQKEDDGTDVSTYTSTSGVILPQPVNGLPKLSLLVDLQQCTYRVISGTSIATILTDAFGNQTQSVDITALVQFAGVVPVDWRTSGIGHTNGPLGGHSVVWSAFHPDENGLMPLGFDVKLFEGSGGEQAVGEASGGFLLQYVP